MVVVVSALEVGCWLAGAEGCSFLVGRGLMFLLGPHLTSCSLSGGRYHCPHLCIHLCLSNCELVSECGGFGCCRLVTKERLSAGGKGVSSAQVAENRLSFVSVDFISKT